VRYDTRAKGLCPLLILAVILLFAAAGPVVPAPSPQSQARSFLSASSGPSSGVPAIAVTTGLEHTCALTSEGAVVCWGFNYTGELGDAKACGDWCSAPVPVSGMSNGVTAIAAGERHTCAITSAGRVRCWGQNRLGQLGDGTTIDRSMPVDVVGLATGIVAIAAGGGRTCAVTTTGAVKCWGGGSTTPVEVPGLASGVRAIALSNLHACVLTDSGGVKCWGNNSFGQLGDGTRVGRSTPVDVVGLVNGVTAIAVGSDHTCAVTLSGQLLCWGGSRITFPPPIIHSTPVPVSGFVGPVRAVAAGNVHTCALTDSGRVSCWGYNYDGELGDRRACGLFDCPKPVPVAGLQSGVRAIATGSDSSHTCAITGVGALKCWGLNTHGQLGNGTRTGEQSSKPVDVVGFGASPIATLTVAKAGRGHGTVTSNPAGINCGLTCAGSFVHGISVRLAAAPDADSFFGGWSGACRGVDICQPRMDADRIVTAHFSKAKRASQPTGRPRGTVLVNGLRLRPGAVPYGSQVDVTNGTLTLNTRVGTIQVSGEGVNSIFVPRMTSENGRPLDELDLVGGNFRKCNQAMSTISSVSASRVLAKRGPPNKGIVRRLKSHAKGRFRVKAKYSYTTVRGTTWLVADTCGGNTVTQVNRGEVAVYDATRRKRVPVSTGKSYVAKDVVVVPKVQLVRPTACCRPRRYEYRARFTIVVADISGGQSIEVNAPLGLNLRRVTATGKLHGRLSAHQWTLQVPDAYSARRLAISSFVVSRDGTRKPNPNKECFSVVRSEYGPVESPRPGVFLGGALVAHRVRGCIIELPRSP
jgi:alpha-tubulin suppressor-like RCC1 family protein